MLSKIVWKTCPTQSQWRNSHSKIMVKAVKHTEKMMEARVSLNYQERMLLLRQTARIVNNHPLEARFRKGNELSLSNVRDAIFACLKTLQVFSEKKLHGKPSRLSERIKNYFICLIHNQCLSPLYNCCSYEWFTAQYNMVWIRLMHRLMQPFTIKCLQPFSAWIVIVF